VGRVQSFLRGAGAADGEVRVDPISTETIAQLGPDGHSDTGKIAGYKLSRAFRGAVRPGQGDHRHRAEEQRAADRGHPADRAAAPSTSTPSWPRSVPTCWRRPAGTPRPGSEPAGGGGRAIVASRASVPASSRSPPPTPPTPAAKGSTTPPPSTRTSPPSSASHSACDKGVAAPAAGPFGPTAHRSARRPPAAAIRPGRPAA